MARIAPDSGGEDNIMYMINDKKGSVAIILALALVPMIGVVGLAIDGGRLYLAHQNLQAAVDSAALAGAQGFKKFTAEERIAAARVVFGSNTQTSSMLAGTVPNVTFDGSIARVEARTRVKTAFMQVLTGDTTGSPVNASAPVQPVHKVQQEFKVFKVSPV